jgi:hypothetical protein
MFAAEALLVRADDDADESDAETFSPPSRSTEGAGLSAEQLKKYLEHLRPEDFGKFNP